MRGATVVALAVSIAPGAAATGTCDRSLDDWEIVRGTLRPAGACGAYLAATDGGQGTFSYGDFLWKKDVRPPLDVAVTWRRLGPETARSLELRVLGALLLVRDGEYGLYTFNEASFEWRPLPGVRQHDEHRVEVHQTATTLSFSLDGKPIDSWPLVAPSRGEAGVAAKGAGGYRSWFAFRDFRAESH